MKRKTATRSALFTSIISLLLCVSMLIGTTFAWFTDTVTSTGNKIQAGTLNIDLYELVGDDEWENISDEDGRALFDYDKWEPGYTQATVLKVANAGTLALQWAATVAPISASSVTELADVIDVYVLKGATKAPGSFAEIQSTYTLAGTLREYMSSMSTNVAGTLLAGEEVTLGIALHMREEAGNEYQGMELGSYFDIRIYATQLTKEQDSFDDQYDKDSWYVVYTEADLRGAIANGETLIKLGADIVLAEPLVIPANVTVTTFALRSTPSGLTLDLGGFTLTGLIINEANLTLQNGTVSGDANATSETVIVNEGTLNLKNGTVEGDVDLTENTSFTMNSSSSVGNLIVDGEDENSAATVMDNISAGATFTGIQATTSEGTTEPVDLNELVGEGNVVIKDEANNTVTVMPGSENMTKYAEGMYVDGNNYYIANVKGMYSFAEDVNDGTTFNGKTVILNANVDLNNEEWTPIGNSTAKFQGTFDGHGNTISNLNVQMAGKSYVGLFGATSTGEIKNLTVENAKVTGRLNVGVVAGEPFTTKCTNITVTGHVEVNGMSYVGGVCGKNAYANCDNIIVNVDSTSYVKANSVENGSAYRTYVGGVVGFNGEGGHTFSNITSNINVIGSTCDVGGAFGMAHYGNNFVNVTVTGNVTIDNAAEAGDAEEMGGIAGVWHNADNTQVTFTNCSFTGKLSANITDGVDLSDNTITGKPYSTSGTGKLIVDGKTTSVVAASDMNNAVTNAKNGDTIYAGSGNVVLPGMSGKEGLTIIGAADGSTVVGGENASTGYSWGNFGKDTTIKNVTFSGSENGVRWAYAQGGTSTFDNCTFAGDSVYGFHIDKSNGATFIFNNCTFSGFNAFAGDLVKVTFNNCTFLNNGSYGHTNIWSVGEFNNCTWGEGATYGPRGDGVIYIDGVKQVSSVDGLKSANGGNVNLTTTVDLGGTQGNYLTLTEDTTVTGGTIKGTGWTGELNYAVNATAGNIVFDGVTFDTTDWSTDGWAQWGINVNVNGTANVTFKNCTFKGTQCPIYQSGADSVITLENCKFESTSVAIQCEIYSGDFALGQDLIVKNCDFTGMTDVLHIYDYDKDPSSEAIAQYLTDNGNTFTGVCKQTCQ